MLANYGYKDGSGEYFITIDTEKCDGCGKCVEACPEHCFQVGSDENDPFRDEPVASVDVFLQSQIVKLLKSMQVERDITYLVISHDLHLVHDICQRIAVIYLGKIVETSGCDLLFDQPKHPYTRFLLGSVPVKNPKLRANRELLEGDVPSPINIPSGCSFHTRCPQKMDVCSRIEPELLSYDNGCRVACHLYTNQHLIDV